MTKTDFEKELDELNIEFGSDEKLTSNESGVNLLREKTFNKELRQLVNKITSNKPVDEFNDIKIDISDISKISEEVLLLRLHQLFYKVKNLTDYNDINTSFNPFDIKDTFLNNGKNQALQHHIKNEFQKLSYKSYAILTYNFEIKGYTPVINEFNILDNENIVISLKDNLFNRIENSQYGIILNTYEIEEDVYLKRKFRSENSSEKRSLYFILFDKIVKNIEYEIINENKEPVFSFNKGPLLMLQLHDKLHDPDVENVYQSIEKKFALPFYLLKNELSSNLDLLQIKDFNNLFHRLDYIFTIFSQNADAVGIIIKSKINEKKISFIIKYMISKFNKVIPYGSVLIHITKNRFIILTSNSVLDTINNIVAEYNQIYTDNFTIEIFSNSKFENYEQMLKEYYS